VKSGVDGLERPGLQHAELFLNPGVDFLLVRLRAGTCPFVFIKSLLFPRVNLSRMGKYAITVIGEKCAEIAAL
jgi:hypothetical protein